MPVLEVEVKITGHFKNDDDGDRQEGNLDMHHKPYRENEDDLAENSSPAQYQEPGKGHVDLFFLYLTDDGSNLEEHRAPLVALEKG